jgi:hypothetical protein
MIEIERTVSGGTARGWTRTLAHGALLILGILLGIAVGHTGCVESAGIALYPVELLDPAASDPFDTDPLLAPAPVDCVDCIERRVALPGGDVATVRAAREPVLRLADDQVAFVELASEGGDDVMGPGTATEEHFGVYAVLEEEGREAWSAFATRYARHFVLVEIEGRPVDLIRPLGWARGLRIGVFEDERQRDAFIRTLPFHQRGPETK